ncbi:MAG: dihydrolipoyl dehydrogenase [Actinomycetes bacterium]|jgi:dihydrolipoamide dehydrogenase|nr:dihydrolipoyl dehydrogenase [Actinomycetes bacterium]
MESKIIVLGGGPGGCAAAFAAARGGAKVTLVERARLGGTCLNVGCIPTKTILRSAHSVHELKRAARFGVGSSDDGVSEGAHAALTSEKRRPSLDVQVLRRRKEAIVDELVGQVEDSTRRLNIEVREGSGRLTAPHELTVRGGDGNEAVLDFDALIIATGSVPFVLPTLNEPFVWTSDDAVSLREIPESIIIIGGGVIGVEFACAYAAFGVQVSVVELAPTLLPGFDRRVVTTLAQSLREQGIDLYLGDSVQAVAMDADGKATATLSSGAELHAAVIMSAVGRVPHTADFGFDELGLEFDRRALAVDEYFRTSLPGIYAVGDAIGGVMLAHAAEAEGEAAAENALAELEGAAPTATVDVNLIPGCVYTLPEVAVVGLSPAAAQAAGIKAVSGVAKYAGNGKALAEGEGEGFVQLVADKSSGALLGAQIVGAKAVELIALLSQALAEGAGVDVLAQRVYAHPTLSELVKSAARIVKGKLS